MSRRLASVCFQAWGLVLGVWCLAFQILMVRVLPFGTVLDLRICGQYYFEEL